MGKAHKSDFADFSFVSEGTIALITPLTAEARSWLRDRVDSEATYWGQALVVEPRYAEPILEGIAADGFSVLGCV
jgi:hypothetical protein